MTRTMVELYPLWLRIWHWLNAGLFVALLVSGISLHFSGDSIALLPFNTARKLHNYCGWAMAALYPFWFISSLLTGNWKHYCPTSKGLICCVFQQAKFYSWGIFRGEDHPFPSTPTCKFNPLQQIVYIVVTLLAMPVIIITGMLFSFPNAIPEQLWGWDLLWIIAIIHYLTGLFLTTFLLGHLYLITCGETLTSELAKMTFGHQIENHMHFESMELVSKEDLL